MRGHVAGFDWDEGNWRKCGKHGVSKGEVKHVLRGDPFILPDRHPLGKHRTKWTEAVVQRPRQIYCRRCGWKRSILAKIGAVARFSCVVSEIKTESGCDQALDWTSRVFLAITRLAKANNVCNCAVFFLRPR